MCRVECYMWWAWQVYIGKYWTLEIFVCVCVFFFFSLFQVVFNFAVIEHRMMIWENVFCAIFRTEMKCLSKMMRSIANIVLEFEMCCILADCPNEYYYYSSSKLLKWRVCVWWNGEQQAGCSQRSVRCKQYASVCFI